MKITNYVDWVNTQKWLRSAARDWLTYNVPDSRNMRLTKISFYDTHIYIEVADREQRKKNMTIKPEELLNMYQMKSFKGLKEGDLIYVVRCFKSNKIYEYKIDVATILNVLDEPDENYLDFYISIDDKNYKVFVCNKDESNQRSWITSETEREDLCELYVDKNMAIEHVKNTYINHIKDVDKHIERLKNRKIDYKEALEKWEKRF